MPGKYEHSEAPRPAPGDTNAFVPRTVAIRNAFGEMVAQKEMAPVPETVPGGRYKDVMGNYINAHGESIEVLPGDSGEPKTYSEQDILNSVGPDSKIARQIIARRQAHADKVERERAAVPRGMQNDAQSTAHPPQLAEDVAAAAKFKADKAAREAAREK